MVNNLNVDISNTAECFDDTLRLVSQQVHFFAQVRDFLLQVGPSWSLLIAAFTAAACNELLQVRDAGKNFSDCLALFLVALERIVLANHVLDYWAEFHYFLLQTDHETVHLS